MTTPSKKLPFALIALALLLTGWFLFRPHIRETLNESKPPPVSQKSPSQLKSKIEGLKTKTLAAQKNHPKTTPKKVAPSLPAPAPKPDGTLAKLPPQTVMEIKNHLTSEFENRWAFLAGLGLNEYQIGEFFSVRKEFWQETQRLEKDGAAEEDFERLKGEYEEYLIETLGPQKQHMYKNFERDLFAFAKALLESKNPTEAQKEAVFSEYLELEAQLYENL